MKIIIERVLDRYDLAHEYFLKHIQILSHYAVKGVSSMSPSWKYCPYSYMVIMYDEESEFMAGGMRLEIATTTKKLPFQLALESDHKEVNNVMQEYFDEGGVAELCGLWVHPYYKKQHIAEQLTSSGIELAENIQIPNLVAFANNHSRPITEELGFVKKSVGSISKFYYPDERYETQLMEKCVFEKVMVPNESHRQETPPHFRHPEH